MKIRLILAGFLVVGLALLAKGEGTAMAATEIFRVAGREMSLGGSLLGETNAVFDRAIWGAMGESRDADLEVHQVTFVFYYPIAAEVIPPYTNVEGGLRIDQREGQSVRVHTKQEVPTNWVRIHDSSRKKLMCEVELLVSVRVLGADSGNGFRRVFLRYEFDQKWSEVPGGRRALHLK